MLRENDRSFTPSDKAPLKVLVIDDDPGIRGLLRIILELDAFQVFEAENGAEGVIVAARHKPDFVLLDYMMPKLNGEATGCRIHDVSPSAVVIACSAHLVGRPYWSDMFLAKDRLGDVPEILRNAWSVQRAERSDHADLT